VSCSRMLHLLRFKRLLQLLMLLQQRLRLLCCC
jgi:hypothetical protein